MRTDDGRIVADAVGDIEENEDGVIVIRRIHVTYDLQVEADLREKAERAHDQHVSRCPVARSLAGGIEVTTELRMEDAG